MPPIIRVSQRTARAIVLEEQRTWDLDAFPVLLRTGAKLRRDRDGFYIGGYAASGSDIQPYRRRVTRTKPETPVVA